MCRVDKSKHFFGDILPEECFTEEAYEARRKDTEPVSEIDNEIDNILKRYNGRMRFDCQWG